MPSILCAQHAQPRYAMSPWSGNYSVQSPIWIAAHTTQFVELGWRYVSGGSGFLDGGGSFVTLASPDGADVTVRETRRRAGWG